MDKRAYSSCTPRNMPLKLDSRDWWCADSYSGLSLDDSFSILDFRVMERRLTAFGESEDCTVEWEPKDPDAEKFYRTRKKQPQYGEERVSGVNSG